MEALDFYDLVMGFFGRKIKAPGIDQAHVVFTGTLYESFRMRCGLDGQHGEFTGGIEVGDGGYLTDFLNKRLSSADDEKAILNNLQMIDEWCRLRLPDKFLAAYEEAYDIS